MKFLRTTLKRSQSPSWARYLLFTLGEMVLIIAGILIALHLDSNKEERGKEATREKYTTLLVEDLQKDKTRLEACLDYDLKRADYAADYLRTDDAELTAKMLWHFLNTQSLIAHDATYQSMIANNALELIDDLGTQKAISEYYSSLGHCQRFEYWYIDHQFADFLGAVGDSKLLVDFMRRSETDLRDAAIRLPVEQQEIVDGHIYFAEKTSRLEAKRYQDILGELNSLTELLQDEMAR